MTDPLRDLLAYLADIGYGDLYLGPSATQATDDARGGGARAEAPERSAPSGAATAIRSAQGATSQERPREPTRPAITAAPSPPDLPARIAELESLAAQVAGCTRCRLSEGRTRTVFGSGNPDADLMFIGEGPGAEEDRRGLPFVGAAGELLTRIIQAIGMQREEVYIANIVKCRPPGNRDPQPDESAACRGYLERQIELVRPRAIVALGRIAAQTLLGNEEPIGRMRGRWYQVRGVPTMVTYHPAALLRNASFKRPTWEDMQQVRDRLTAG